VAQSLFSAVRVVTGNTAVPRGSVGLLLIALKLNGARLRVGAVAVPALGAHRRHTHSIRAAEPALRLVPPACARLAVFGDADTHTLELLGAARAGDPDHTGLEPRVECDQLALELMGRDELDIERILIALWDLDLRKEPAGKAVVLGRFQPGAGPMRPIFMDHEPAPGHHVTHAINHCLGHKRPPGKLTFFGVAGCVLRLQTMQHEIVSLAITARAL